jgi:glycosyltransferase involved in cell wall biosynthesis
MFARQLAESSRKLSIVSPSATIPNSVPIVSVIVPCRNEGNWIARCLQSIVDNDYPNSQLEVLVVDGMSDDGTRAIIEEYARGYSFIRMIDNPRKITPTALNAGIAAARGAVIIRMDAHVEYPIDYISKLSQHLEQSGADNVGGVCRTCPANETARARAIAIGLSHPLGVGNSYFRIGSAAPRWVDTVPFGCYRRDVFDRIGPFDEELIRNQDDELNLRLIRAGGRILLLPDVVSRYFARDSLSRLWRMYFQYGYFKPLVVRKIGRVMTLRQLIPSLFVATLAILGLAAFWSQIALVAFCLLVALYLSAIAVVASSILAKQGPACAGWLVAVIPTMHFAYGFGFIKGAFHFLILRRCRREDAANVPISR